MHSVHSVRGRPLENIESPKRSFAPGICTRFKPARWGGTCTAPAAAPPRPLPLPAAAQSTSFDGNRFVFV